MTSARTALRHVLWGAAVLIAAGIVTAEGARADTLDRIRADKTLRVAYRQDAPPFSYKDSGGHPAGYMVDLCKAVAEKLKQQLSLPSLSVVYVSVTATDRFATIQQHKADLLCEPTSATLARRELVDFSIATFVDGAGLMVRADATPARDLKALAGQKIGVLAGTTTEGELHNSLKQAGMSAEVIPAKTHAEGLAMLENGTISAYFADRSILTFLLNNSKTPMKLLVAENYLTVEPYALALPRGDENFRLAVDRALSHIYRSGEVVPLFNRTFGAQARPSQILETLYLISGLPD